MPLVHVFLLRSVTVPLWILFFFNDTATTEIYTLSLHDALPIFAGGSMKALISLAAAAVLFTVGTTFAAEQTWKDRKSTRLNSSHDQISYAVFCLKKKKKLS